MMENEMETTGIIGDIVLVKGQGLSPARNWGLGDHVSTF